MLEAVIDARPRDLGDGMTVRRSLPAAKRRMVGPFIFFDQMGPVMVGAERALDVRPHPHINLATVTYLFEGEILHRDSLGSVQAIRPGDVNWMTAGRGIVHSERTPPEARGGRSPLFGIQTWLALPDDMEESAPSFIHIPAGELPLMEIGAARIRLMAGTFDGVRSPVPVFSPTLYADAVLGAGARVVLRPEHIERAAYVVDGSIDVAGRQARPGELLVFAPGGDIVLEAAVPARALLFGGMPLGIRHIWWNFVSSRRERIRQAAEDWEKGRFDPVPGETGFIPLPQRDPDVVDYP